MNLSIKHRRLRAGVLALAWLSQGCFSTSLVNKNLTPGAEKHEEWNSFFFWGLAGEAEVNVAEICHQGEAWKIEEGTNGATWLVSLVTLGIYSPRKVYVTCAAPSQPTQSSQPSQPSQPSQQQARTDASHPQEAQ
ncbi:Bor family protein [Pendulispora brunnea]|uniref:Bor family protein n=1 Tax=Pendulispora brunnea TaxID=2905690 RepID=A0ABZ2KCX9_9BACT